MSCFAMKVIADADSNVLCRILGNFAQGGHHPPSMTVRVDGSTMVIEMTTKMEPAVARRLSAKVESIVGVSECDLKAP